MFQGCGGFVEEKKGIHWAWIVLATCFVNLFINYSVRLGYGVVLPEMIRDLGFSRTAGGSIYNAYLITYVAITPLTGYLTDRFGARRVISACAFILGVGVLLMGTVHSIWMAIPFYAIAGLGSTGMWTPVITVVQRWFTPYRRGLALGILSAGYGLGFATTGVAFPWIVSSFSWRYAWYVLGVGALVMVLVNGLLLRSNPESAGLKPWGQKGDFPPTGSEQRLRLRVGLVSAVFREKTFWLIGFSYFCVSYSLYGITTFMVDFGRYQMGLPLEKASLLATIHGACQVLGVLSILPLSDYFGRKKTIIFSNSFITATLAGILFIGNSWMMLFILVGILAIFYGVTFPIYGACAGDYFPKEVMGTVIGAWTPFYGSGAIAVHWVSGILRDTTGRYDHAFFINAVMAGIGLFLITRVGGADGGTRDS
jgi:sugar phosphate permease